MFSKVRTAYPQIYPQISGVSAAFFQVEFHQRGCVMPDQTVFV
jgi:hypothetical protein